MVILSVLFSTLLVQVAYSRRLVEDIDNDVSPFPGGNLGSFKFNEPNEYVRINLPPEPLVRTNVGTQVELKCEAVGTPPPNIEWYKGNRKLTENDNFEDNNLLIERNQPYARVVARLIINYVLPRHQGNYYCVATSSDQIDRKQTTIIVPNGRGREMNLTQLIAHRVVGAPHPPKVTFWASSVMDYIGNDVTLPCRYVGNPKPDQIWLAHDAEVTDNDKYQVLPDGSLSIRSITWEDMGVYKCMLKNSVGDNIESSFLYPMQPTA